MDVVRVAARNNAEWCDAFCRTHGIAGRFERTLGASAERTPPFDPDAVTLLPGSDAESVLSRVDASAGCSIKDRFALEAACRAGSAGSARSRSGSTNWRADVSERPVG
jgi:hypothetical protein